MSDHLLLQSFSSPGVVASTTLAVVLLTLATTMYYRRVIACPKGSITPPPVSPKISNSTTCLYYNDTPLNKALIACCGNALQSYQAPWYCQNPHLQIVLNFVWPQKKVTYRREILTLADGGSCALDWPQLPSGETKEATTANSVCERDASRPLLVVLHGLTGCSRSMQSMCVEAITAGYRPVVFNKRGHGGVKLTSSKLQPFGDTSDFTFALESVIVPRYPHATGVVAVGFSAGSGLVVSYLGEKGTASQLSAAVLVSPGYDASLLFSDPCPNATTPHLGIRPLYNRLMTFSVWALLKRHQDRLSEVVDYAKLARATTLHQLDILSYMRFDGCSTIEQYWKRNNPMRQIPQLAVPVLCLNAMDDPVCSSSLIPTSLFTTHPTAMLVTTPEGSHCGFITHNGGSWAHGAAIAYLNAVLSSCTPLKSTQEF